MPRDYSRYPEDHRHRLFARIQHEPNSGCWLWDGALSHDGYAVTSTYSTVTKKRTTWYAHRAIFALGAYVDPALELDHKCRTRCCVNPAHLEPVTGQQNKHRSPLFGIHVTHCPLGHEYTADNIRWVKNAKYRMRGCRTCMNRKVREYQQRQRDARGALCEAA
jgi:hypothetical protein